MTLTLALAGLSFLWSINADEIVPERSDSLIHPRFVLKPVFSNLVSIEEFGPSGDSFSQAQSTLQRSPLEGSPFALAAFLNSQQGRYDEAHELVAIARKRDPRSLETLILSMDINLAHGDIVGAVENLEVLLRRAPRQRNQWREVLRVLASAPETSQIVFETLEEDRNKVGVLADLAGSGLGPVPLLQAVSALQVPALLEQDPTLVAQITNPIVQRKDYEGAYQVWAALSGLGPKFADNVSLEDDLPPPFGWEFRSSAVGYAVRENSGIVGEVYGRRSGILGRQLRVLPPGFYQLRVDAPQLSDSAEIWIRCTEGPPLLEIERSTKGLSTQNFEVSLNCPAQWLEVRAKANVNAQKRSFTINAIAISEVAK